MIRCEPIRAYLPEFLREKFLSSPIVSAFKLQNSVALSPKPNCCKCGPRSSSPNTLSLCISSCKDHSKIHIRTALLPWSSAHMSAHSLMSYSQRINEPYPCVWKSWKLRKDEWLLQCLLHTGRKNSSQVTSNCLGFFPWCSTQRWFEGVFSICLWFYPHSSFIVTQQTVSRDGDWAGHRLKASPNPLKTQNLQSYPTLVPHFIFENLIGL